MGISIIIVSWNVLDYLKECLESVYRGVHGIDVEVFVVDNNSSDKTIEFIKAAYPQVNIIANRDNPGFATANNQAIAKSKGRYVLLLNPDTVVMPDSINRMVEFMDSNSGFGAVGPQILGEDKCTVSSCAARGFPSIFSLFYSLARSDAWPQFFIRKPKRLFDGVHSRETDSLSGACMMVRKEAIDKVGALDDSFFMYAEDIDWCYRIKKSGWKIFYLAESIIVHFGERSALKKWNETENMVENFASYYKYFKKHYGPFYAICYRLMFGFTMAGWNIFWIIRLHVIKDKKERIREIIVRNMRFIKWSIGAIN